MANFNLSPQHAQIVGSFGHLDDIESIDIELIQNNCNIVEVRLDLLFAQGWRPGARPWKRLSDADVPLLFTARCHSEGGAGELTHHDRENLLLSVIADAALIDIELASADKMAIICQHCMNLGIPWVASFHDFSCLPASPVLIEKKLDSQRRGASAFKIAAALVDEAEMARLEDFQKSQSDYPVSSMGMGALAIESRIRCGLAGSVLNYGFLGQLATAPGQCRALDLREQMMKRQQLASS